MHIKTEVSYLRCYGIHCCVWGVLEQNSFSLVAISSSLSKCLGEMLKIGNNQI